MQGRSGRFVIEQEWFLIIFGDGLKSGNSLGKKELATLGAAFRSALKQKCLELEEKQEGEVEGNRSLT